MTEFKTYSVHEPFLKTECKLGEGPFYEQRKKTIRFTDIESNQLHVVDVEQGPSSHEVLAKLPFSIGVTADIEHEIEYFAFAGKYGFGIFNHETREHKYIYSQIWTAEEQDRGFVERLRMNDGAVDPRGRFWAGTMTDQATDPDTKKEGVLFRLDPDLTLTRVIENVGIPNGISWTDDEKSMYFTDSMERSIFVFDIEMDSGKLSNKRLFYMTAKEGVVPDGHAVDVEDHLWVALHGGGKVIRLAPSGEVAAEITVPTRFPTCPVFVEEELYITTAADDQYNLYPESAKVGGSLFKCAVGIRGKPKHQFKYKIQQ